MAGDESNNDNFDSTSSNHPIKNILNDETFGISNLHTNEGLGGSKQKWKKINQIGQTINRTKPQPDGEEMGEFGHVKASFNVESQENRYIDHSKLIIPLLVNRSLYQTHEELYYGIRKWWLESPDKISDKNPRKGHGSKTIINYIRHARAMEKHPLYPVDWFKFDPHQIINQMLYREHYEYPEKARELGDPTYGVTQLNNFWKTIRTFANAFGMDVSWWPWRPPAPPEHKRKNVPRPHIVNALLHYRYSKDRKTTALIRTLLTLGFQTGARPEELIALKLHWVDFDGCCINICEQKKRFRERLVWVDPPVMFSHQQNSIYNWINVWRPRITNEHSGDYLFIQTNGKPFESEDHLRRYLSRYVKPAWEPFCPKVMRDWCAIGRLIRTKLETKKWDTRQVTKALGHKYEKTTEEYIEYAEQYFRQDSYDWLRAVLKFHPTSRRMQRLMKQQYRPCQEIPKKSTNDKNRSPEVKSPPVAIYGPGGIRTRDLQLRRLPPNPG